MSDDPLRQMITKRDEHIVQHKRLMEEESFVSKTKRLQKLTEGLAFGLHSTWLMSKRSPSIFDDFLTFRFFDDTIQSIVAIWSLAKEGQLTPAKREMRYLLESCAKHIYVDLKQMGKTLNDKLKFLEEEIPCSSISFVNDFRLYAFSDVDNKEFIDSIRSIYSSLCRYVHRSPEQIQEACRLLQRGVSPGFETAQEVESFCRELSQLYDLVLVMHFNALGMSLTGNVFTSCLDDHGKWPFHKTKFVKKLSVHFDYKHERKVKVR